MTYSEWMSNQTVGRRGSNLRVQEEKDELEVNSPVPVYNIVYTECTSDRGATPETDHGPVVIEASTQCNDCCSCESAFSRLSESSLQKMNPQAFEHNHEQDVFLKDVPQP